MAFELAGVRSGDISSGHRILGTARMPVTIENYEQQLCENFVLLSADARRKLDVIERALRGGPARRLPALRLPGLYRQTWPETILFRWWFLIG